MHFAQAGRVAMLAPLLFVGRALSLVTNVIPERDMAKKVRLTRLADFAKSPDVRVRTADFDVSRDDSYSLLLQGHDRNRRAWVLTLPASMHGLWVTTAEKAKTYFFAGYTGGAGMAPPAWIIALSFDEYGKPVPFCVRGWARYSQDGIEDLVNLDGTGPELIQQDWIETDDVPDSRSGYYVTTLYQQRGVYWYRVDGPHGARAFPLFERWLMLPGREPEEVAAPEGSGEWMRDYGNDPRLGRGSSCRF